MNKRQELGKGAFKFKVETTTKIVVEMSQDGADCLAHQLDEVLGGEVDDNDSPDLHDFINLLNQVTS